MNTELVVKEYLGNKIEFKIVNGEVYANATSMCKAFGKLTKDWLKNKQTSEYIEELERGENYPNGLVIVKQGGVSSEQGTWVHEKLILDLARWLNIKFRIWCDEQIATLLREGNVEIKPVKKLEDKTPMEQFKDNVIALNEAFTVLGLNIPKEIIGSTAITTTQKTTGYDFEEVKLLLTKQDEEQYHSASSLLSKSGIKRNKTNATLTLLGLQVEGDTTMHPYVLTELGKEYGVERSYASSGHQGYEIKWKSGLTNFVKDNLDKIPASFILTR